MTFPIYLSHFFVLWIPKHFHAIFLGWIHSLSYFIFLIRKVVPPQVIQKLNGIIIPFLIFLCLISKIAPFQPKPQGHLNDLIFVFPKPFLIFFCLICKIILSQLNAIYFLVYHLLPNFLGASFATLSHAIPMPFIFCISFPP